MRTLLKVLGTIVLLVVVAVCLMFVLGSRLPHEHTASVGAVVPAPQAKVWQLINDVSAQPSWRTGLKAVEVLPEQNGHPCWQETNAMGKMPLCETVAAAPAMRIVRITDPSLPFGGSWTYQLTAEGPAQTRVVITENGTTGPAIWRFLGHYAFHEDTSIRQYLDALQVAAAKP